MVIAVAIFACGGVARAECPRPGAAPLYAEARRAFQEKRFDDSVELLRRAYVCEQNPVYLANIARSYEEADQPRAAIAAWQEYLVVVTDERERSTVKGRVSALSKMIQDIERLEREKAAADEARRRAEQTTVPGLLPPVPAAPRPRPSVPLGAWIVTAAGAVGLAGGAVLWAFAESEHTAAVAEVSATRAESLQNEGRSLSLAANWSLAVGGAVAATGLAWAGVSLLRPSADPSTARIAVRMAGTNVTLCGAF